MQRLKTRPQFQAVLAGSIVAKTVHFALHRNALAAIAMRSQPVDIGESSAGVVVSELFRPADMWIGAMVPKRWAKRAVTRNAIKRQIYTVSANFSDQYPQAAYVVRLRRGFDRSAFVSASSEPLKQLVRAEIQDLMQAGARAA